MYDTPKLDLGQKFLDLFHIGLVIDRLGPI